jgi:hypothetical protein
MFTCWSFGSDNFTYANRESRADLFVSVQLEYIIEGEQCSIPHHPMTTCLFQSLLVHGVEDGSLAS